MSKNGKKRRKNHSVKKVRVHEKKKKSSKKKQTLKKTKKQKFEKEIKKSKKLKKIKIKKKSAVIPKRSSSKVLFTSERYKISTVDNLLCMDEFKNALVEEDIFNKKSMILPFMKYLENEEVFSHYFEEDFPKTSSKGTNDSKPSHGEIFHFLHLTNKFIDQSIDN